LAPSPPALSCTQNTCKLWLCNALRIAENTANIQKYVAGEVVEFKISLRIPHTGNCECER
jgi:hypothetical protein